MFLETSAKTAENVNDVSDFCYNYQAFNSSAKMVLDVMEKNKGDEVVKGMDLKKDNNKQEVEKKKCC